MRTPDELAWMRDVELSHAKAKGNAARADAIEAELAAHEPDEPAEPEPDDAPEPEPEPETETAMKPAPAAKKRPARKVPL